MNPLPNRDSKKSSAQRSHAFVTGHAAAGRRASASNVRDNAIGICRAFVVLVGLAFFPTLAFAQAVVYHLHNEGSATAGFKQLKTAAPDVAQAVVQTAALQGVAVGEKKIIEFDTAAGTPNTAGKIPSGATVNAVVWMRKTANLGTMFPRVKVRLNSSSGTALCTATGTTALTTTLTAYTLSCTTTANITMVAADRLYVWTGVNLTVGSSAGAFRGEMGVEGTLNGSADSRIDIPTALPAPAITTLTPNVGPIGQSVTIAGTNFRDQQLTSVVKFFNNRTATVTSWSNTSIVVTVPASSATGAVTVTVAGTASAGVTFTVGAVPTIAQLAPNTGLPGTSVAITGSNFGATKGSSTVKFNGVTAATSSWSASSITATVPAAASTGNVVVTVGGIASAGVIFTVPVLTAVTVSPADLILPIDSQQRYKAIAHYSDGSTIPVGSGITWSSTGPAVATVNSAGIAQTLAQGTAAIQATVAGITGQTGVNVVGPGFVVAGTVLAPRQDHTATLLPNGKVLIAAGVNATILLSSAELYDSATRSFAATGSLVTARFAHTSTLLLNGKVLIAGGRTLQLGGYRLPTTSAEIYDPATGTFAATGNLQLARARHTATVLTNGLVVIAGGEVDGGVADSVEVYDPAAGTFTTGTTLSALGVSATRLDDGTVLLAGGGDEFSATTTTRIYSDVDGSLTTTGSLATASRGHTASKLPDGTVLVAGGSSSEFSGFHSRAEVYYPGIGLFSSVQALVSARASHTANELADGSILVVGGFAGAGEIAWAERFDPTSLSWIGAGSTTVGRVSHTATTLGDGTVLIVGGAAGMTLPNYAELYGPPLPPPTSLEVTPETVTLPIEGTRQYVALDELGRPRHDATWTVSDTTRATIGTYGSPTLTALDYGQVTVTATIGAVTGQASLAIEPASLFVTPSTVTMLVGESRSFSVVDEFGHPRANALWSADNPSAATVVPGTGVVSALGNGNVVLTATIGSVTATAQLTVSAGPLPEGALRWAVAGSAGATSRQVLQSDGGGGRGPALFAIDISTAATQIRGLTPDGQQLWQSAVTGRVDQVTPNGRGGVLLAMYANCDSANPMRLVSIDGTTGGSAWQFIGFPACASEPPQIALRHDGGLSITTTGNFSGFPSFMMLDGASGASIPAPAIPPSTFTGLGGQVTQGYSRVGPPMVDSSGATHLLYEVRHVGYPLEVTQTAIWLMKVEADGTSATTQISSTSQNVNQFPGRILPDDRGGVVVTWTYSPVVGGPDANPLRAARVSESGTVTLYALPIQPAELLTQPNSLPVNPMLALGENDTAFASYGPDLVSFDLISGALNWGHTTATPVTIISSDAENHLYAKTTTAGTDNVLKFNAAGLFEGTDLTGADLDYGGGSLWLGSDAANAVNAYGGSAIDPQSVYPTPTMGRSNASKKFYTNYSRIELETSATPDQVFDTFLRTFRGVNNSDQASVTAVVGGVETMPINISGVGQTLRFTLTGVVVPWFQGPFDVVTVRFDAASRVIAAETVGIPSSPFHGHPLFGWRYWKVFQPTPGQIVVETGALARPSREYDPIMTIWRWVTFGMDRKFMNAELTLWKQMLEDVNTGLNPAPGSGLTVPQSTPGLIGGKWEWMDKAYILRNLCGDAPPFAIPSICY